MASGSVVGALRFILGADTAVLERNLKSAEGALRRAAAVGTAVGNVIANVLTRAFGSLTTSIRSAIDEADKLSKLSQSIGISTERLSELNHVANLSGVSLDVLGQNVVRLSRAMSEAATNTGSQLAQTFRAIGVSVTDTQGNLRSTEAVLLDLATRFQGWTDGAGKAAIATRIFGETGAALIPFLNQGASGINALTEEARRLGLTISTDTGRNAEAFNDTMTKLKASFDGFVRQVMVPLLPLLQQAADMFRRWTQESQTLRVVIGILEVAFKAIMGVIATVNSMIEDAIIWIGALINAVKALADFNWSGFTEAFRNAMRQSEANGQELINTLRRLRGEIALTDAEITALMSTPSGGGGQTPPPIITSTRAVSDAMRQMRDEARAALDTIVNAPTETFAAKMAAISQALRDGTINYRTYGQMVRRVEDENRNNILSTASLLASTLTAVFGKNKTAAIASAIINTAVGITRAMQLPPPFSWAQAALIAATGAAQIATIKSTNVGSGGGTPSVSGAGAAAQDQQSAAPQTLTVQGLTPGQFLSSDYVRDLAQQLLDFQADGGLVVLK